MCWGIGRYISSRAKTLRSARVLFIAAIIAIFGMPVPVLSILQVAMGWDRYSSNDPSPIWMLHAFYPFFSNHDIGSAPIYGLIMLAIGLLAFQLRQTSPSPARGTP